MTAATSLEGFFRLVSVLAGLGFMAAGAGATLLGLVVLSGDLPPLGLGLLVVGPLLVIVGWRLTVAVLEGTSIRYEGRWWRR